MTLEVREATLADARVVASKLRDEDREEIEAAGGVAHEVIPLSVALSRECFALTVPGEKEPFLLCGVSEDPKGNGVVWLLSTPTADSHPLAVLRSVSPFVDRWLEQFPMIHNISMNSTHLRWVVLLGFTLGEFVSLNGVPFRHFFKTRRYSFV